MTVFRILLAIPVIALVSLVIIQPSEEDFVSVRDSAVGYAGEIIEKYELGHKAANIVPFIKQNMEALRHFVSDQGWFKRDKSITVRNVLTTGSITRSYTQEELKGNLKLLRESAAGKGRKLAVLFEAKGCYYCKKLNTEILTRPDIKRLIEREFELVRIDINSYSSVVDLDGAQMTETTLAKQWKVTNTPTMIFFPADRNALPGNEIILSRMAGVPEAGVIKELLYRVSAHGKDPDALAKLEGFRSLENGESCSSGGFFNPFSCMKSTLTKIVHLVTG